MELTRISNSFWFYLLIGAVAISWVALFNGYPIVYSDTSTYLSSGFEFETPFDRPITYGLFIYLTSFGGVSLWFTVFFQSLIVVYLIYLLFKYFTNTNSPSLYSLLSIITLSFTSSLPWISGMLIADIFTPITIISLLILLLSNSTTKKEKYFLYFIFFLSNAMHMSHLLINLFLIITILLLSYFTFTGFYTILKSKKQLLILLFITLSGIVIMSSAMSKSKHIFYMGRMVENGILKKYLDETCENRHYQICDYKDSLPKNADRFLWDFENSPIYKLGGWKTTKKEFNEIISATFSNPKYLKLHIAEALNNTKKQLMEFNLGEGNVAFAAGTKLHERIGVFIPNDLNGYEKSKQTNSNFLLFNNFNTIQKNVIYISVFLLISFLFFFKKKLFITKQNIFLILFVILGIVFNDFICASLSTVANRFSARVMWLIPLLVLLIISNNKNKKGA